MLIQASEIPSIMCVTMIHCYSMLCYVK